MTPRNDLLDHAIDVFPPPDHALERVARRHAVRRRNRRIGTGVVALAIGLAAVYVGTNVVRSGSDREPLQPSPSPAPSPSTPYAPTAVSLVDIRSGRATPLPDGLTSIAMAWNHQSSPDGSLVAFEIGSLPVSAQVHVANIDGSHERQLTFGAGGATDFGWSPEGAHIVFVSEPGEIWVVDVRTGEVRRILGGAHELWHPVFSPDGDTILFTLATKVRSAWRADLWTVPSSGGDPTRLIEHGAYGEYSPDGTRIAYHRTDTQPNAFCGECWWVQLGVAIAAADGSTQPGPATGGTFPSPRTSIVRWSPDGTRVVYSQAAYPRAASSLLLLDVASRQITKVGTGATPSWFDDDTLMVVNYKP